MDINKIEIVIEKENVWLCGDNRSEKFIHILYPEGDQDILCYANAAAKSIDGKLIEINILRK